MCVCVFMKELLCFESRVFIYGRRAYRSTVLCVVLCVCMCCVQAHVCVCVCVVSPGVGCVWRSVQSGCGVRETVQQSLIIVFVLILQQPTLSDIDLLLSISLS